MTKSKIVEVFIDNCNNQNLVELSKFLNDDLCLTEIKKEIINIFLNFSKNPQSFKIY